VSTCGRKRLLENDSAENEEQTEEVVQPKKAKQKKPTPLEEQVCCDNKFLIIKQLIFK
jgi:hypothetical protein